MEIGFECKEIILVFELYYLYYFILLGLNVFLFIVGIFEYINFGFIVRLEFGG